VKYGLKLREERRIRVFENRLLRRIFRMKRVEIIKDNKKSYNIW
jgi:hypothetical protein